MMTRNSVIFREFTEIMDRAVGIDPRGLTHATAFENLGLDSSDKCEIMEAAIRLFRLPDLSDIEIFAPVTIGDAVALVEASIPSIPETILGTIAEIIEEVKGVEATQVIFGKSIRDDLKVDSLDAIEIAARIEDQLDCKISDEAVHFIRTVDDLVVYVWIQQNKCALSSA